MERLPVFKERLLLVRRRLGMSQETLAREAGLFNTDISKYERGQSMPTLPRLVRLARALGCTSDSLLGLDAPEEIPLLPQEEGCELAARPHLVLPGRFRHSP